MKTKGAASMISIGLDESGTFENASEKKKMVGGIVYKGDDFAAEKERLEQFFIELCKDLEVTYPNGIHSNVMKDWDKKAILLNRVKDYLRTSGQYHITCILKSTNEKTTFAKFSNIIDEDFASNLYERMIIQLIHNLLFYNPYFVKEQQVVLDLAKRVYRVPNSDTERLEKYHQLGYGFKPEQDRTLFYLTDQPTFKTALSTKLMDTTIQRPIDFTIDVESINYYHQQDTTPFLYLADCVCSIIRDSIHHRYSDYNIEKVSEELRSITGNDFIFFAYDDIDDQWNELFTHFQQRNFIECLDAIFTIKKVPSPFSAYYQKYWVKKVEDEIFSIFDERKINLYLGEVEYLITNKDRERDKEKDLHKGLYIGEMVWKAIETYGLRHHLEKIKYKLSDILIRGYNHKGDTAKAKTFFQHCEQLKNHVSPEDYCATFLNVAQIYANEFDFQGAMAQIEKGRSYLIRLKEIYQDIAVEIGQHQDATKYPLLGKIESSIGQFHSFQRNHELALRHFQAALSEFDNQTDSSITVSYLLQMALDQENLSLYQQYVEIYLNSADLVEQFDFIIRERDPYRLFVFVKSLTTFKFEVCEQLTERLLTLLDQRQHPFQVHVHPWELIYKHLSILFYGMGDSKNAESAQRAIGFVSSFGAELTIHVLNLYSEIILDFSYSDEKKDIAAKLDKLKVLVSQNEKMESYFRDVFEEKTIDKKIECLDQKFTFTYR
jgi:tetratricopeptide (TPR) repeat protein